MARLAGVFLFLFVSFHINNDSTNLIHTKLALPLRQIVHHLQLQGYVPRKHSNYHLNLPNGRTRYTINSSYIQLPPSRQRFQHLKFHGSTKDGSSSMLVITHSRRPSGSTPDNHPEMKKQNRNLCCPFV